MNSEIYTHPSLVYRDITVYNNQADESPYICLLCFGVFLLFRRVKMHSLNGSWRPERRRPTKRKAHLSLHRENTKRKVEHSNLPSKEQLPVD